MALFSAHQVPPLHFYAKAKLCSCSTTLSGLCNEALSATHHAAWEVAVPCQVRYCTKGLTESADLYTFSKYIKRYIWHTPAPFCFAMEVDDEHLTIPSLGSCPLSFLGEVYVEKFDLFYLFMFCRKALFTSQADVLYCWKYTSLNIKTIKYTPLKL